MPEEAFKKALLLLNSVSESAPLSLEEKQQLSVELASLLMQAAFRIFPENRRKKYLRMVKCVQDLGQRALVFNLIDNTFRVKNSKKNACYLLSLIEQYKIAPLLHFRTRLKLLAFKLLAKKLPVFCVGMLKKEIYKELSYAVVCEKKTYLLNRLKEITLPINLAHLNEKVLSKEEAQKNLQRYLSYLLDDTISCVSLKASAISSDISFLDLQASVDSIAQSLKELYQAAGLRKERPKMVFLEMENYHFLLPTLRAFQKALEAFPNLEAGITLQAYLPESFAFQEELTAWARARVEKGGAPIHLCLVKGAYLGLEQITASKKGWPQAPFTSKIQTDANYTRMLNFGLKPNTAPFVHITVATHNIFEIAYSLLLTFENRLQKHVFFQTIKGQSDHIGYALNKLLPGSFRFYLAAVEEEEFAASIPYAIRRLEEFT
ncbi:MAG: proline dehydrogenase family protein, partial [Parachlamydiales bacterium]